jgi:hypothetical protein
MQKLGAVLPSSIASPKSGKTYPKAAKARNSPAFESGPQIITISDGKIYLAKAVPSWESVEVVPRGDSNRKLPDNRKAWLIVL